MRIIGGRFRRRQLASPPDTGVRPTSDRLRETLFNVLASHVHGARVLDAFAGTGALGLEALSRGAAAVTLVERDPRAMQVIMENIRRCEAEAGCRVVGGSFPAVGLPARSFDLVFLDPPYDHDDLAVLVEAAGPLLAASGMAVLEHTRRRASPEAAGGLRRVRLLRAGDSALSFYRPSEPEPSSAHD